METIKDGMNLFVVMETKGEFGDAYSKPIRIFSNYQSAKDYTDNLNAKEKQLYKNFLDLREKLYKQGLYPDDVDEQVFKKHLETHDQQLLEDIERVEKKDDTIDENDGEILDRFNETMEKFMLGYNDGKYREAALLCGYDQQTIELLENAIEYNYNYPRPSYHVCKNSVPSDIKQPMFPCPKCHGTLVWQNDEAISDIYPDEYNDDDGAIETTFTCMDCGRTVITMDDPEFKPQK